MQITIEIPDQIARQWGETPNDVARHVLEGAAVERYRAGRLTQRQVGAMLGLDYWQTESFLNERAVPINYLPADLAADHDTLEKI
jgi:predicted HTH domain antitoxin